jgi:formiminotetrahydrofolate cyclodeaminase/Zn-dependent peptidase ImmA (M78 family)
LAARLILTVINLTKDCRRNGHYSNQLPDLLKIESELENRILPELQKLFQLDSDQFDKVIQLREMRDAEVDPQAKKKFTEDALKELKPATEIPIRIARECVVLARYAIVAFDHGFKSARGDSGVAIHAAVSAISGCLSIVELNLLSFSANEWTVEIRESRNELLIELTHLNNEAQDRLTLQRLQTERKDIFSRELDEIRQCARDKHTLSETEIEQIAVRLQRAIWTNRDLVWKHQIPDDPFEILKPEKALKCLDYQLDRCESLGQHTINGTQVEVAGLIDQQTQLVSISLQFPLEIQNFTTAHELGHSLLHRQQILHRDRPLDGSAQPSLRSGEEWQADKFATYYLMPKKLVKKTFLTLFLSDPFRISEATTFALNEGKPEELYEKCKALRGLSRLLAKATFYDGVHFDSISTQFKTSIEAMAIRLEELGLVEFTDAQ